MREYANPYAYVAWNPINRTDPTGLVAEDPEWALKMADPSFSFSGTPAMPETGNIVLAGVSGIPAGSLQSGSTDEQKQAAKQQEQKAEVGYGETAGLVPQKSANAPKKASPYNRRTWDPASTKNLQDARTHVMDVSERNDNVKRATPDDPKNKIEQAAWQDNVSAAKNSQGKNLGNYLFIRQEGVEWQHPPPKAGFGQGQPIREYGPFRNVGGGDVPTGPNTYIDIYNE